MVCLPLIEKKKQVSNLSNCPTFRFLFLGGAIHNPTQYYKMGPPRYKLVINGIGDFIS